MFFNHTEFSQVKVHNTLYHHLIKPLYNKGMKQRNGIIQLKTLKSSNEVDRNVSKGEGWKGV